MTARGIKVNHDGSTLAYAVWASANFVDFNGTSFTICGWQNIRGASAGSNTEGHTMFSMPRDATDVDINGWVSPFTNTANSGTPWTLIGRTNNNSSPDDVTLGSMAANANWFVALSWDTSTNTATWYYAIDGAGSLSSASGAAAYNMGALQGIWLGALIGGHNKGSNMEITNVKVWVGSALSSAELFQEMNSEAVVNTTNLSSHWKLASAADLTDYSGNSHTLSLTGTVNDGTMDPVDIQTASGSGCLWYGTLKA